MTANAAVGLNPEGPAIRSAISVSLRRHNSSNLQVRLADTQGNMEEARRSGAPSKRIIEPREGGNTLGTVADVHVSDHERLRDAAKPDAVDTVQIGERVGAGARIHPADIDEGGELHVDGGRGGNEGEHLVPEFDAAGKGIAIVEASLAE